MKKLITILSVVAFTFITASSNAQMLGQSNESREYMVSLDELRQWSIGFYYKTLDRDLANPFYREMSLNRSLLYVGYDPIDVLTLYVQGGVGETKVTNFEGDNNGVVGLGARFNIIDKEIMDPTLLENRLRLTAGAEYNMTQAEISAFEETDFNEFTANLLLSLSNDLDGNKDFVPNSIALFVGPEFSTYMSDDDVLEENESLGLLYGLQVFYTDSVAFNFSAEMFDEPGASGFNAGVHVRF